jgi:Ser/Thr protein kinase RdoA (MazF antagonist)
MRIISSTPEVLRRIGAYDHIGKEPVMGSGHLDPNLPQFSLNLVKKIVADLYQIDGDYKELHCERDISYRIRSEKGAAYVVKISNAAEPQGLVDFQIKALQHLAEQDRELKVPHMIHTKGDRPFDWIQSNSGDRHMIRMLSFVAGDVMDATPAAFAPQTRYHLGVMVGRLAKSLRNFFHPYARSNAHLWDMSRCLQLRPYVKYMPDASTRRLCNLILDRCLSTL